MTKYYTTFIFLFGIFWSAFSQHTYDSTYTPIPGYTGHATFDYDWDIDHLMVKNGHFSFTNNANDTSWKKIQEDFNWSGHYEENKKNGAWTYFSSKHLLDIQEIKDDHIEYELKTINGTLEALYKKGTPTGTWVYTEQLIEKGSDPIEILSIEVQFSKGKVDGTFSMTGIKEETLPFSINGTCKKGLFVGDMNMVYGTTVNPTKESRKYDNGILLDLNKTGAQTRSIVYEHSPQTTNYLAGKAGAHLVNSPYELVFNDGYSSRSPEIKEQMDGRNLLNLLRQKVLKYDLDWESRNGNIFGANRGVYPLSEEEEKLATQWYLLERTFKSSILELEEKRLQGFQLENDSTTIILDFWIERQNNLLKSTEALSKIFLSHQVEYYYRSEKLLNAAQQLLENDSLRIHNRTVVINYTSTETSVFMGYMVYNIEERIKKAERFDSQLKRPAKSTPEQLTVLSERIKRGQSHLDSIQQYYPKSEHIDAFLRNIEDNFIQGALIKKMDAYEKEESGTRKKALGDSVILELFEIEKIYELAINIAKNTEYNDSLYTEYVFDAFTFSDNVPTRLKKKLYDQFWKIQQELFTLASTTSSTSECIKYLVKIQETQTILVYLHDKNTKDLERQLQRTKNLEEKLKILGEVL